MIDYSTLQGLIIPEGVVIQIADASGRVIWVANGGPAVLQVEKITDDTYVNDTVWYNDNFILLDIYPQSENSVVNVTYGGLTKTLKFSGTNAQQVYFGTYGGVADDVTTPASGELTIEGEFSAYGCGTYKADDADNKKYIVAYCSCITDIIKWGSITTICDYAFSKCTNLTSVTIPNSVKSIGGNAFSECTNLTSATIPNSVTIINGWLFAYCTNLMSITIPDSVTSIDYGAFGHCTNLTSITIPDSVTSIGMNVFYECSGLTSVTFGNTSGWYVTKTENGDISTGTAVDVTDPANNVTLITDTYAKYYWYKS